MRFDFIVIFGIFRTIEVLSLKKPYECVKRKSGACKAFDISDDFDLFVDLDTVNYEDRTKISSIIEFDYKENKYSYELERNKKKKEFDTVDNPLVELLFSDKDSLNSFRLVLGEKLNRLAYIEINELKRRRVKYNNYSPDLPTWPFAINVTVDFFKYSDETILNVYTKNGDGFDNATPFLRGKSGQIQVQNMAVRNRNKNIKLVGFYDCSTKYGSYCGVEETRTITDCRRKISPLGGGFFYEFVNMSRFNRLKRKSTEDTPVLEYNEIFGIYRRNNDNMHIIFSSYEGEARTYVRITIGNEIIVRVRTFNSDSLEYYERTAVKKGWNQEPSEPNFIRIKISAVTKIISIHDLTDSYGRAMLTMKLCNYFEWNNIRFMSVSSDRFKSVDLYYDCCLKDKLEDCHIYERKEAQSHSLLTTTENSGNTSTTTRSEEEYTSMNSSESDTSMMTDKTESQEALVEMLEISTTDYSYFEIEYNETDEEGNDDVEFDELVNLTGVEKKITFLNTTNFHKTHSVLYVYEIGTSMTDYCPHEIADVELTQNTEENVVPVDEEDVDVT